jgi:hypothetical protein
MSTIAHLITYHGITHKDSAVYSRIDDDDEHNTYTIKCFAGILAKHLLIAAKRLKRLIGRLLSMNLHLIQGMNWCPHRIVQFSLKESVSGMSYSNSQESINSSSGGISKDSAKTGNSSCTFGGRKFIHGDKLAHFTDIVGNLHTAAEYPWKVQKTDGQGYTTTKYCIMKDFKCMTMVFCIQYSKPYCFGLRRDFVQKSTTDDVVNYFSQHVKNIKRLSNRK